MIYVFYVPGSFGSTIEYVIRSFTNEYELPQTEIATDGSMHKFSKLIHVFRPHMWQQLFDGSNYNKDDIVTPLYPMEDVVISDFIETNKHYFRQDDKFIVIHITDFDHAEINKLFQYHKIMNGSVVKLGLSWPRPRNIKRDVAKWNPAYTKIEDLELWEYREWQSLTDLQSVLYGCDQVPDYFLKISTTELLNDTFGIFRKIINFCELSYNQNNLHDFAIEWRQKQQYVLDEHKLIVNIVDATIKNIPMSIPQNLNIIAQSIIQQRLRRFGYEIKCHGLNNLPDTTCKLHDLLDSKLIHSK